MLTTAWRKISTVFIQGSSHSRQVSHWYRKLDDKARATVVEQNLRAFQSRWADPIFRETYNRKQRLQYRENGPVQRRRYLHRWCTRYSWLRERLPWKTRRPIYYAQNVEHHCSGCDWTRKSGTKLWYVLRGVFTFRSPSKRPTSIWYLVSEICTHRRCHGAEDTVQSLRDT